MTEIVHMSPIYRALSSLERRKHRTRCLDAASIRELFGTFDCPYASAITGPLSTNDMDSEHEESEDNDVDSDVDKDYWSSVRDLFYTLNFLISSYLIFCKGYIIIAA